MSQETTSVDSVPAQILCPIVDLLNLKDWPDPEYEWIVEGMLPAGAMSMLFADAKAGKSTLIRNLLLRVSRGEPFLNRPTQQGPVLYICMEDKPAKAKKMWHKLGVAWTEPIKFYFGRIAPSTFIPALYQIAERYHPILIVVDTLAKAIHCPDLNDYSLVTSCFIEMDEFCRQYPDLHLMLLHHARKAGGQPTDRILGSVGLYGGVDVALYLDKHLKTLVRSLEAVEQRYDVDIPKFTLEFDKATDTYYVLDLPTNRDDQLALRIQLSIAGGETTRESILDAVAGRKQDLCRVFNQMIEEGRIQKIGSGIKGDPYRYSLPNPLGSLQAAKGSECTESGTQP